ncbi:TPA: hypothetical protein HA273_05845 [Candidatus Bathyarchaeota archaeon]|nr:hypothetical protein [Candidatus Bathyarchaeota archaeon]HIJ08845.1 hypothetical protein [Candidatus Bathyarchaeota archaeon]
MAIFAALYYVLALIAPIQIPTGVGNLEISFAALIAAVIGIVLGPYLGAASAFLGAFLAWVLPPSGGSIYGLPFLLSPPLNAFITGLIFYKKWKYGFVVFAALIVAYLFTPPVVPLAENFTVAVAVLTDKIVALLLILPVVMFAKKLSVAKASLFYFLLFFIGNMADNMWGTLIFSTPMVYDGIYQFSLDQVRFFLTVSPLLYPAVRLIQAAIGMIIAVPLMQALKGTPWLWQRKNVLSPKEESTASDSK